MLYILDRGFVRAHDKPIRGSCAIYFPGGIYTQFLYIRSLHLPLHVGKFFWDRQHMQAEAWVFSVYGKNRPGQSSTEMKTFLLQNFGQIFAYTLLDVIAKGVSLWICFSGPAFRFLGLKACQAW